MKLKRYLWITILTITALFDMIITGKSQQHPLSKFLFKIFTISDLSITIYARNTKFKESKKSGNFCLRTVNYLQVEMI